MALTNAEKQKNWRECHIMQRITSLLLRQTWSDEHLETLLVPCEFNRWGKPSWFDLFSQL